MAAIQLKAFALEDLNACLEVEKAAVKSNHYLKDVVEYYATTKGELTLGVIDGKIVGMGKLTILFDGSAWLELLRVHPNYQRQGVGAQIYRRYLEQIEQYNCPAARMYTGVRNVPSAALAQKNGLHRGPEFHGMSLDLTSPQAQQVPMPKGFSLADGNTALDLLLPLKEQAGGFFSINHTFYEVNPATCRGMAAAGWVYHSEDSVIVLGARFQPQKVWYIAVLGGNQEEALRFAIAKAVASGIPKLTIHCPMADKQLPVLLEQYGFAADPSDDVVMEWRR